MSDERPSTPPTEAPEPTGDRATVVMPEEPAPAAGGDIQEAQALVGRVLAERYRVEELVAAGGMGAVFRGEHVHLRHRVAIKVLLPSTEKLPELVARFEREAIAGAHIRHPNVAAATDFGHDAQGNPFLILEYARGKTLSRVMAKGPLGAARAVKIAREIAVALVAVHERGVVHRDLKPSNVMVDEDDSIKLIDFGFAKVDAERLSIEVAAPHAAGKLTEVGVVLGTVPYMAPEIAKGMEALDARADLYALGIILYEMLAGKHPFAVKAPNEYFAAHLTELPPPIAVRAPGVEVPAAVEAVVTALLAKKPGERFQSAQAVVNALDAALAEAPSPLLPQPRRPGGDDADPGIAPPAHGPALDPAKASPMVESPGAEPPRPEAPAVETEAPRPEVSPEAASPPGSPTAERPAGLAGLLQRLPFDSRRIALYAGPPVLLLVVALAVALSAGEEETSASEPVSRSERVVDDDGEEAVTEPAKLPPPGPEAIAARSDLLAARNVRSWVKGAEALTVLAQQDPRSLEDGDIRAAAAAVLAGIGEGGDTLADPVFAAVTEAGEPGFGVLWDVLRTKGGTRAQQRAIATFRRPEIAEQMSPALRVAFEVRMAPCGDKEALFAQAAEVGDARTLQELQIIAGARCKNRHHVCCFRDNRALRDAISALAEKLGS